MRFVCPECKSDVESSSPFCPECGCPMEYIKSNQTWERSNYSASTNPQELLEAAEYGNPIAMYWLGYCMYYGKNEFNVNKIGAAQLLAKAGELGFDKAKQDFEIMFSGNNTTKPPYLNTSNTKAPLHDLLESFDSIVVFDLETSGLSVEENHIIQISAIKVVSQKGNPFIAEILDEHVKLPEEVKLSPKITALTGITDEILEKYGKPQQKVCQDIIDICQENRTLLVAFNAQFDMCFLRELFYRNYQLNFFSKLHAIDALTVFKDRHEYPHRLEDAIKAYKLNDKVSNSHNAFDDAMSLFEVLKAMDIECADLKKYVDLFGYNPRYGISGKPLRGVKYCAQPYNDTRRVYEM